MATVLGEESPYSSARARPALGYGATREELMEVFQLVSVLACTL
ncbi:hypothetical protein [Nocardia gamkensis]